MTAVPKVLVLVAILGLVSSEAVLRNEVFVPWYDGANMCANLPCSEPRPTVFKVVNLEGYDHSLHRDIWPRRIVKGLCGKRTGCCEHHAHVCTATHRQTLVLEFKMRPSGRSVNITTTEHTRCGCRVRRLTRSNTKHKSKLP